MYRIQPKKQLSFEDFYLPFGGHLNGNNRWVQLAALIPWEEFEDEYAQQFSANGMGAPAKSFRMALGAELIRRRLNITDEEVVEQIRENPYLQYFIGMECYRGETPFDPSMMTHFRNRLSLDMINRLNERIIQNQVKKKEDAVNKEAASTTEEAKAETPNQTESKVSEEAAQTPEEAKAETPSQTVLKVSEEAAQTTEEAKAETPNQGKLLLDATCIPQDIRYPTDLSLLNEVREKTEKIIDRLHEAIRKEQGAASPKKPRTYRKKARKDYLSFIKKGKKGFKSLRRGIRKQLQYIRRNLKTIEKLTFMIGLWILSEKELRRLSVCCSVFTQQEEMYKNKEQRVADRIVSISQPHIRPIKRGKAAAETEFGSKLTISVVDGYTRIEKLAWDNYNEGTLLKSALESYKARYGYYPSSVHVDKIFLSKENRKYCKERGIRISGPPLGRPSKDVEKTREARKIEASDARDRIPVEGKFGNCKRKYGLDRIFTKKPNTSECEIGIVILLLNLELLYKSQGLVVYIFVFFYVSRFTGMNQDNTAYNVKNPQKVAA